MKHSLVLSRGGQTLYGVLHLPDQHNDHAVVILHGWGSLRTGPSDILVHLSQALAARGIPSCRFDFTGRGESTGIPDDTTLDTKIDDTITVLQCLRHDHGINRFTLVGLCSGGNVALGALKPADGAVERVIAWSLLPFMKPKLPVPAAVAVASC